MTAIDGYIELLQLCNSHTYDPFLADMQRRCLEALYELLSDDNYISKYMSSDTEERYNHNHDPHTGRFTSGSGVDNGGKSGIIKAEGVGELEQAKKRDHKILVTDIAIEKIPKSNIHYLSAEQNNLIYENHKALLRKSQIVNNSDEVAMLFDLNTGAIADKLGSEHKVNVFENPNAVSMHAHAKQRELFLAHNHPSTQDFSYSDLGVFIMHDSIGGISVVSNSGNVHILYKTEKYDFSKAYECISNIRNCYTTYNEDVDKAIVKEFLKVSSKVGIESF